MISIIKTAIITIIISFISGLLLEYYKNLAPRILCKIGNGRPIVINNRKNFAYIITVRNLSNKTIHDITLNIQSTQSNLKLADTKVARGLRFESSIEDNILDIDIPFFSKGDEISIKVYVENLNGVINKPVAIIRSPENFKQVDSEKQIGIIPLLLNTPKSKADVASKKIMKNEAVDSNKVDDFTLVIDKESINKELSKNRNEEVYHRNKKTNKNIKPMITIVLIVLVMVIVFFGNLYFEGNLNSPQTPNSKTNVQKQATGSTGLEGAAAKNKNSKLSKGRITKNNGVKITNNETVKNAEAKAIATDTTKNIDEKASTGDKAKNSDTKSAGGETPQNVDTKSPAGETSGNTDTKGTTGGATGGTETKTPTGGTTENADSKESPTGATENTGN